MAPEQARPGEPASWVSGCFGPNSPNGLGQPALAARSDPSLTRPPLTRETRRDSIANPLGHAIPFPAKSRSFSLAPPASPPTCPAPSIPEERSRGQERDSTLGISSWTRATARLGERVGRSLSEQFYGPMASLCFLNCGQ